MIKPTPTRLRHAVVFFVLLLVTACSQRLQTVIAPWVPYDETAELAANADHESRRMQYQLIQSRVLDRNAIWQRVAPQLRNFTEADYQALLPLILEQDILTLQVHVRAGTLTYEKLTQWYLYRIVKYENDRNQTLNAIIAINSEAVAEAREKDRHRSASDHPIYGIPILLKDNIDALGMPTTAGAHALLNNSTTDAFIVTRIKAAGGIILGKTNLSEWANFLCQGCPNGYSAVGGQTLNAYGRKVFDTGVSSSGSGAAMAANYAAAAVGTETSGSILSPSSKSSLVGLKPTVGLLSRGGIVPISSTLDTPGPMTRNVTDNAILLSAMAGEDPADVATRNNPKDQPYLEKLKTATLQGQRFGVFKDYLKDSLYQLSVATIVAQGGIVVEFEPAELDFDGFGRILSADMKVDLPHYLQTYASPAITLRSVADVVRYNEQDTLVRIPYGQARFAGILDEDITPEDLLVLKKRIHDEGVRFFEEPLVAYQLDAILSVNNQHAGYAAAAQYPCLTVPMGYSAAGEPNGLTFIGRPFTEDLLLEMGYAFEQASKRRKLPVAFGR